MRGTFFDALFFIRIRGDRIAYSRVVSQDADDKAIEFQFHSLVGRDTSERIRVGDAVFALIGGKPAKLICTKDIKPQQVEEASFRALHVFASTDPTAVYGSNSKMPARIRDFHSTHLPFEADSIVKPPILGGIKVDANVWEFSGSSFYCALCLG